jgi:hypothetical protein
MGGVDVGGREGGREGGSCYVWGRTLSLSG